MEYTNSVIVDGIVVVIAVVIVAAIGFVTRILVRKARNKTMEWAS